MSERDPHDRRTAVAALNATKLSNRPAIAS
jgi:hypothetical protein